jgi:hypothetical protein
LDSRGEGAGGETRERDSERACAYLAGMDDSIADLFPDRLRIREAMGH